MTEVGTEEFDRAMDIAYEQFKLAVDEFANNVEKMVDQYGKCLSEHTTDDVDINISSSKKEISNIKQEEKKDWFDALLLSVIPYILDILYKSYGFS